jgi:hypothetical protein
MWWSGTQWKPGSTPCNNTCAPAEVFPDKGNLFSNIKGERQRFWVFVFIVLLDKDKWIMPEKQIFDAKCVTIYLYPQIHLWFIVAA